MRLGNLVLAAGVMAAAACGSDSPSSPNGGTKGPSVSPANALVAGSHFTCALTAEGAAYCWGANDLGQLGTGTPASSPTPALVAGPGTYTALAGGDLTMCALRRDGSVDCWGEPPGAGSGATSVSVPRRQDTPELTTIGAGLRFACGLDDSGSAWCWGANNASQLGVGDTVTRPSATKVVGGLKFKSLSVGLWHACGLTSSGAAYCWGDNSRLEALGTPGLAATPTLIDTARSFASISAGASQTCGIAIVGGAYCWGSNYTGQRGSLPGLGEVTAIPAAVETNASFASIHISTANDIGGHACATTASGDLYCWGLDDSLQTGTPGSAVCKYVGKPTACEAKPVKVPGITGVIAVATGMRHSCALKTDHTVVCWGANSGGELGDGTRTQRGAPAAIAGGLVFP